MKVPKVDYRKCYYKAFGEMKKSIFFGGGITPAERIDKIL